VLLVDPIVVQQARVVSGIRAGFNAHGVYRPDRTPVLNGTLVQGDRFVQGFATPEVLDTISDEIAGEFVYGGCAYGHFGHLLLETFARLSVFFDFELPVLFTSLNHTRNELFWRFVDAVDLPKDRIKVVDAPSIVERLVVPAPDFRIRAGITLPFLRAFECLGDRIAVRDGLRQNSNPVPVYLSRSRMPKGRRYFFGEKLIEASLRAQGCDILFTETMTIEEQIAVALTRTHIIGFAGSALHTLVFCRGRKRVTYLSTDRVHTNFSLIESLKRNDAQEVVIDAISPPGVQGAGPFLLSRRGIAEAASVLAVAVSEDDIDAEAYAACVDEYHTMVAGMED